jgi:hypothetical protein
MCRDIKTIAALAAALVAMASRVSAQECSRLQGAPPAELTSYLDGTGHTRESEPCAAFAINQLGSLRYKPAIPALMKMAGPPLAARRHQEQRRFVIEHDGATIYPAAAARCSLVPARVMSKGMIWSEYQGDVARTEYPDRIEG